MKVKEGDTIKYIGNHCYKGREGIVEQVEDVDGVEYIHSTLNGSGEKIITRPGQYKVIERGYTKAQEHTDKLSPEIIAQVHRVSNNQRYSISVRKKVLEDVQAEIQTLLTMLWYEEQGLRAEYMVPTND